MSCCFFLFRLLLFSVLFSLGRHRAPFFCVRLFGVFFIFIFFIFFIITFFHGLYSTQLFLYWFCSQQFAELGSIHLLAFSARACSLAFLCLAILFLGIFKAFVFCFLFWFVCFFIYTYFFFQCLCLGLSFFSDSVDFSYFFLKKTGGFFVGLLLQRFSSFWFCYF